MKTHFSFLFLLLFLVIIDYGCEGPDLNDSVWGCNTKNDCGSGWLCSDGVCIESDNNGKNGVFSDRLVFGFTGPLTSSFSNAYYEGLQSGFNEINMKGGIYGRNLEINAIDDQGNIEKAEQNANGLLNGTVFSIFAAETAEAVVESATNKRGIAFGMASGSLALRADPPDRYVFNFRPSESEEVKMLLTYIIESRDPSISAKNISLFVPILNSNLRERENSLKLSVENELNNYNSNLSLITYPLGTTQITESVSSALKWLSSSQREVDINGQLNACVIIAGESEASSAFIKDVLDEVYDIIRGYSDGRKFNLNEEEVGRISAARDVIFVSNSSTEIQSLTQTLKGYGLVEVDSQGTERFYCQDIVTTQPVPHWEGGSSGILAYRDALESWKAGSLPSFASFEGYAVSQLMIESLKIHGKDLAVEAFISTLENLNGLDIGIGAPVTFSPSQRQGSDTIFSYKANDSCDWEKITITSSNDEPPLPDPCENGVCPLIGTITQDTILTSDKQWLLRGPVFIGDGVNKTTLTINPGTTIMGDFDTKGYLSIRRGSKIIAEGTREMPIIFTSSKLPGQRSSGDWGGLVINGAAPINTCAQAPCESFGEGGTGAYGGNKANDDSGILKYVRIEFAGRLISTDNELNGLSMQGVGNGTIVDYVQIHKGKDDGIEFFGGTVNVKHLYITGAQDDSLDWTEGWTGNAQFIVIKQHENGGNNGIEADNNGDDNNSLPRSNPIISNLTLIGNIDAETSGVGFLLREGTSATIKNAIATNFDKGCIDIDHDATFEQASSGAMKITNSIFYCDKIAVDDQDDDLTDVYSWFINQEANLAEDPMIDSDSFMPLNGSPALNGGVVPSGDFFENVTYRGAMGADNWLVGWTTNQEN